MKKPELEPRVIETPTRHFFLRRRTCPVCGRRQRTGWVGWPFKRGKTIICDGCYAILGMMEAAGDYNFLSVDQFADEAVKVLEQVKEMLRVNHLQREAKQEAEIGGTNA